MSQIKTLLVAAGLIALLSISGCSAILTGQNIEKLSPEQIEAYGKMGQDVYFCLVVGGPPPIGSTTTLIVPKGKKIDVSFASNCQLMRANMP